ncbi:McrC family protein [Rhodococcoides kroppenstedtii]|uniref:McrC family protein n=1 Tax=Rhodococcoides kroppenstedtii TaxID=293050 RepID=UPI003640FDC8
MIELNEHSEELVENIAAPSIAQQTRIQRTLAHRLQLEWLSGNRLHIRSGSHVGVATLPGGITIRVHPKIAGGTLGVLTMFALSSGARLDELEGLTRTVDFERNSDTVELMCRLLSTGARAVLSSGPICDYRSTTDDLEYIRGRLDFRRQSLIHFNRLERLACVFDEYDHDIVENRLILQGLIRARRLCRNDETRAKLIRLISEFKSFAIQTKEHLVGEEIDYDRRNLHYRPAHIWARAILDNRSFMDAPAVDNYSLGTFMIDMNKLFEAFVEWFVAASVAGTTAKLTRQQKNFANLRVDRSRSRALTPDIVLRREEQRLAVDAKYKNTAVNDLGMSDVYQLLTYAQIYRGFGSIPMAMVVLPSLQASPQTSMTELSLRGAEGRETLTRVEAFGLPLPELVSDLSKSSDVMLKVFAAEFRSKARLQTEIVPSVCTSTHALKLDSMMPGSRAR